MKGRKCIKRARFSPKNRQPKPGAIERANRVGAMVKVMIDRDVLEMARVATWAAPNSQPDAGGIRALGAWLNRTLGASSGQKPNAPVWAHLRNAIGATG